MFETYKPSGKFGVMAIPAALIGLALAVASAFVYQLGLYWIPLIYISFLLTWFYGIGLGMAGSMIVRAGKIRNVVLAVLIGLAFTVAAVGGKFYFQHRQMVSESMAALEAGPEVAEALTQEQIQQFVDQELTFAKHIEYRVEQGWEIGKPGRNGGLPIKGPFVYLIWALELGIIAWSAVSMPAAAAAAPYSEKLDQWASEEEVVMTLPVTSNEMVAKIKAASTVDELMDIPIPKTDESNQFAVYRVNSIEGQEMEDAYLSVDLMTLSLDKNGEQTAETKPLVQHAVFTSQQREQLVENADLLKEALDEYQQALEEEAAQAVAASTEPSGDAGATEQES